MNTFTYLDYGVNNQGIAVRVYNDVRLDDAWDLEQLDREYDKEKNEYIYVCLHYQTLGPLCREYEITLKGDEWTQEKENKIINDIINKYKPGCLRRLINKLFKYKIE